MRPSGAAQADVAIGPRFHRRREERSKRCARRIGVATASGSLRRRPGLFARCARKASFDFEVFCGRLAAIADDLVLDLLAFIEGAEACALYGRDVDEHVLAATLRLNEAVALGGVE